MSRPIYALWSYASERENREKGAERLSKEIMAKNFPNLMKDININVQKAQQTPRKANSRDPH